jgi:hypothetical protein
MGKRSVLDQTTVPELLARLRRLTDDSKPSWGRFAPGAMLNHLRRALAASLGVTRFEDLSNWWLRCITKPRVLWGLKKIPRNKIKLPAHFLDLKARSVAREISRFEMMVRDFVERAEREPNKRTMHPYFGLMKLREWQRWHWLHFQHHFAQFGV